jgi:hypothetical protein
MFEIEVTKQYIKTNMNFDQKMEIKSLSVKKTKDNRLFNPVLDIYEFEGYVGATFYGEVYFGKSAYMRLNTYSGMSTAISCNIVLYNTTKAYVDTLLGFDADEIIMDGFLEIDIDFVNKEITTDFGHSATFRSLQIHLKELGNFQISGGHHIEGDIGISWDTETFTDYDMVFPDLPHLSQIIINTDGGINGAFGGSEGFTIEKWRNGGWDTLFNFKGAIELESSGQITIDIHYKKVFAYELGKSPFILKSLSTPMSPSFISDILTPVLPPPPAPA